MPPERNITPARPSANDGDDKVEPGNVHRSPGIYLMAEENHLRSLLGDRLMKTVLPVIASIGVPYLQVTNSAWSIVLY